MQSPQKKNVPIQIFEVVFTLQAQSMDDPEAAQAAH